MIFPTDAQLDWLQAEILASRPPYAKRRFPFSMPPAATLAAAFRRRWGIPVTARWIRRTVKRHWQGLRSERTTRFTWAQRRYLRVINRRPGMTAERRTELFNRRFDSDVPTRLITAWVSDRKRRKTMMPFPGLPGDGRFRKGNDNGRSLPVGTIVVRHNDPKEPGAVMVKVAEPHPHTGSDKGHMRLMRHVVWERERGPIPKGHCIVHLDGDPGNWGIENLECVTHAELARLNQMRWRELPADLETRKAAVAAMRLKQAAFDVAPTKSALWARRKRAEMEAQA